MKNQSHKKHNDVPVVFVDIDETICFYEDEDRVYERAVPSDENIDKVNKLFDSGWVVIYWTARGSSDPNNESRVNYLRELTLLQLEKWGARYHELQMGDKKPMYDLIIDDKAKRIEEL